jgi:hypothetical protein
MSAASDVLHRRLKNEYKPEHHGIFSVVEMLRDEAREGARRYEFEAAAAFSNGDSDADEMVFLGRIEAQVAAACSRLLELPAERIAALVSAKRQTFARALAVPR